ncbi:MAG: TatD family hydrolase [Alistipes sp.]|nr:TatD family hydrolase [Alistipes sp.]
MNIHTHTRTGRGVEVVSVMAGRDARRDARLAAESGEPEAADLAATASVCEELPAPPFSIGLHPWQVGKISDITAALAEVEQAAAVPVRNAHRTAALAEEGGGTSVSRGEPLVALPTVARAAAIGEIGIDAAIREAAGGMKIENQRAAFAAQLEIAERHSLPVVLHCVRAFEAVMEIVAEYSLPGVLFHGFVGLPEQAARAVGAGYYLSFGPRSLSSPRTVEAMRAVPPERMFLETDAENVDIDDVYTRVAGLLGTPREELVEQLCHNYKTFFKI